MPRRLASPLLTALDERVLVADGAMGTMLQSVELTIDDFAGLEGCNETLNVTRPGVVLGVPRGCRGAGAGGVEPSPFGASLTSLGDYGIADRIFELAQAGAAL